MYMYSMSIYAAWRGTALRVGEVVVEVDHDRRDVGVIADAERVESLAVVHHAILLQCTLHLQIHQLVVHDGLPSVAARVQVVLQVLLQYVVHSVLAARADDVLIRRHHVDHADLTLLPSKLQ